MISIYNSAPITTLFTSKKFNADEFPDDTPNAESFYVSPARIKLVMSKDVNFISPFKLPWDVKPVQVGCPVSIMYIDKIPMVADIFYGARVGRGVTSVYVRAGEWSAKLYTKTDEHGTYFLLEKPIFYNFFDDIIIMYNFNPDTPIVEMAPIRVEYFLSYLHEVSRGHLLSQPRIRYTPGYAIVNGYMLAVDKETFDTATDV